MVLPWFDSLVNRRHRRLPPRLETNFRIIRRNVVVAVTVIDHSEMEEFGGRTRLEVVGAAGLTIAGHGLYLAAFFLRHLGNHGGHQVEFAGPCCIDW